MSSNAKKQPKAGHLREAQKRMEKVTNEWDSLQHEIELMESEMIFIQDQIDQLALRKSRLAGEIDAAKAELKEVGRRNDEMIAGLFRKKRVQRKDAE